MLSVHLQYIKDVNGNKSLVVLRAEEFDIIMEELEDLEDVRLYDEAKKEDKGERILFSDYLKNRKQKNAWYTVILSKKAQKQLDKLSDKIAEPILEAISSLKENPRPQGYKKLKGREGSRIRVGNYRVIYNIFDNELIVDVITLGNRRDIYE